MASTASDSSSEGYFSFYAMVIDEAFHRGRDETGEGQSILGAQALQFRPAGASETADHAHGEAVVAGQGTLEQIPEVPVDQAADIGIRPIVQQEGGEAPEVAGRGRSPVNVPDDGGIIGLVEGGEGLRDVFRDHVFDQVREEHPAEGRGAAFVPDDEAAAVDVADDGLPVVMARV